MLSAKSILKVHVYLHLLTGKQNLNKPWYHMKEENVMGWEQRHYVHATSFDYNFVLLLKQPGTFSIIFAPVSSCQQLLSFIATYYILEYYITTEAKTICMFCSCYDSFHTCNDREINNSCSGFNFGDCYIQFELYISRVWVLLPLYI